VRVAEGGVRQNLPASLNIDGHCEKRYNIAMKSKDSLRSRFLPGFLLGALLTAVAAAVKIFLLDGLASRRA